MCFFNRTVRTFFFHLKLTNYIYTVIVLLCFDLYVVQCTHMCVCVCERMCVCIFSHLCVFPWIQHFLSNFDVLLLLLKFFFRWLIFFTLYFAFESSSHLTCNVMLWLISVQTFLIAYSEYQRKSNIKCTHIQIK